MARPELIIEDSSAFVEFSMYLKSIKWMNDEFPHDSLLIFWGDEINNTPYALYHSDYSKDSICDNCGLVMLKEKNAQRVIFCYKEEGIYSPRAYMDWETWEVTWY